MVNSNKQMLRDQVPIREGRGWEGVGKGGEGR